MPNDVWRNHRRIWSTSPVAQPRRSPIDGTGLADRISSTSSECGKGAGEYPYYAPSGRPGQADFEPIRQIRLLSTYTALCGRRFDDTGPRSGDNTSNRHIVSSRYSGSSAHLPRCQGLRPVSWHHTGQMAKAGKRQSRRLSPAESRPEFLALASKLVGGLRVYLGVK